ncbi:MAG: SDR family NAD(P)-dependent oxidoreductase [Janthinobacterium lividum]
MSARTGATPAASPATPSTAGTSGTSATLQRETPRPAASPPLHGRAALVTGSSDGLGLAIAEGLAAAGCNIVLHGLETAGKMAPLLRELGTRHGVAVDYLHADLRDPAAVERLMREAGERVGRIDILVNNAVIRHFAAIDAFPLAHFQEALAVNVTAAFRAIQLALPAMRAAGWGRIFNMTSVYGARAVAQRVDYVTTKTALLGLTRAVAIETVNDGITCNAICPGSVLTPNIDGRIRDVMAARDLERDAATRVFLAGKQPGGKLVEAAHVADMVVFLCGPAGSQITGAMMPIEGGWLAS